jgi:hypothetical protein
MASRSIAVLQRHTVARKPLTAPFLFRAAGLRITAHYRASHLAVARFDEQNELLTHKRCRARPFCAREHLER